MKNIIALAIVLVLFNMSQSDMIYAKQEAERKATKNEKQDKHRMAIVIDDLGNKMEGTDEILSIEMPVTVAVMPFLPTTKRDAEAAHAAGHEVIVHMPMEPKKGLKKWLGPGAITVDLSNEEVRARVEAAIDQVPYAVGMNNHMGSKVTENERVMRIILEVCKERNLYYLDSKTSFKTVAGKLAEELGVPYAENSLFLDDEYTAMHVHRQMQKAFELIQERESTVIIGHVGPPGKYTSAELVKSIPTLQQFGKLVYLSELIKANLIDPEVL